MFFFLSNSTVAKIMANRRSCLAKSFLSKCLSSPKINDQLLWSPKCNQQTGTVAKMRLPNTSSTSGMVAKPHDHLARPTPKCPQLHFLSTNFFWGGEFSNFWRIWGFYIERERQTRVPYYVYLHIWICGLAGVTDHKHLLRSGLSTTVVWFSSKKSCRWRRSERPLLLWQ